MQNGNELCQTIINNNRLVAKMKYSFPFGISSWVGVEPPYSDLYSAWVVSANNRRNATWYVCSTIAEIQTKIILSPMCSQDTHQHNS